MYATLGLQGRSQQLVNACHGVSSDVSELFQCVSVLNPMLQTCE